MSAFEAQKNINNEYIIYHSGKATENERENKNKNVVFVSETGLRS